MSGSHNDSNGNSKSNQEKEPNNVGGSNDGSSANVLVIEIEDKHLFDLFCKSQQGGLFKTSIHDKLENFLSDSNPKHKSNKQKIKKFLDSKCKSKKIDGRKIYYLKTKEAAALSLDTKRSSISVEHLNSSHLGNILSNLSSKSQKKVKSDPKIIQEYSEESKESPANPKPIEKLSTQELYGIPEDIFDSLDIKEVTVSMKPIMERFAEHLNINKDILDEYKLTPREDLIKTPEAAKEIDKSAHSSTLSSIAEADEESVKAEEKGEDAEHDKKEDEIKSAVDIANENLNETIDKTITNQNETVDKSTVEKIGKADDSDENEERDQERSLRKPLTEEEIEIIFEMASMEFDKIKKRLETNPDLINFCDPILGNYLLHWVAQKGKTEDVNKILAIRNINFSVKNNAGQTCLHVAAIYQNYEALERLKLLRGLPFDALDYSGRCASDYYHGSNAQLKEWISGGKKAASPLSKKDARRHSKGLMSIFGR